MNEELERIPPAVRAEIQNMVLAISRKQLTQEQAMIHVARYCLSAPPREVNLMGLRAGLHAGQHTAGGIEIYCDDTIAEGTVEVRDGRTERLLGVIVNVGTAP